MPGGMARIAAEGVVDIVSSQRGGGTKDVWVLAENGNETPGAPTHSEAQALPPRRMRRDELPSQLVENLYWLGRYSERCEDKTRLLRATLSMRTNAVVWRKARAQCIRYGVLPKEGDPSESLFDDSQEYGLAADLGRLGWCATQSRSVLSAEHWRAISVMQQQFNAAGASHEEPLEALDALLVALSALSGFALDDMTQDDGWRLLMLGRRLERVQFLAGLLADRLKSDTSLGQAELEWLLDVGGVSITYRTRYAAMPQLAPALQLLVFDEASPRALGFQWAAIRHTLSDLAESLGAVADTQLEQPIARLISMAGVVVEEESESGHAHRHAMATALAELADAAGRLSERLALRHFSLVDLDLQTVAS
jgi:uncharacterized alpha-E superfamily protein